MKTTKDKIDRFIKNLFRPLEYIQNTLVRAAGDNNEPLSCVNNQGLLLDLVSHLARRIDIQADLDGLIHGLGLGLEAFHPAPEFHRKGDGKEDSSVGIYLQDGGQ